jgi:hypothetical protein
LVASCLQRIWQCEHLQLLHALASFVNPYVSSAPWRAAAAAGTGKIPKLVRLTSRGKTDLFVVSFIWNNFEDEPAAFCIIQFCTAVEQLDFEKYFFRMTKGLIIFFRGFSRKNTD